MTNPWNLMKNLSSSTEQETVKQLLEKTGGLRADCSQAMEKSKHLDVQQTSSLALVFVSFFVC